MTTDQENNRSYPVCHAPGDKCLGCDHYYGKADKCKYEETPTTDLKSMTVEDLFSDNFSHEDWEVVSQELARRLEVLQGRFNEVDTALRVSEDEVLRLRNSLVERIADLERQLVEATTEIKEARRAFGHDYSPSEEEYHYCKECGLEQYSIIHTNCFDVKKKWMLEGRKPK